VGSIYHETIGGIGNPRNSVDDFDGKCMKNDKFCLLNRQLEIPGIVVLVVQLRRGQDRSMTWATSAAAPGQAWLG
jgi:hypothetical protein